MKKLQDHARQVAALPWRLGKEGQLEFLLVTSRVSRHWLMPKGWPIPGKTDVQSALQEAFEEAGIRGTGSKQPLGTYDFVKAMHDGSEMGCEMSVFPMSEIIELEVWPEMDQRERLWVPQVEAIDLVYDWNQAKFLAEVRFDRSLGGLQWTAA
jgi:8-oxo-dGTP pyrophosphatase MutT (NUDIX family)